MHAQQHPPSPDVLRVTLGDDVRKLRKARGLSLTTLAQAIGRSVGFVSQLERGRSQPSIADLRAIAGALGVPLGWFFMVDALDEAERGHVVRAGARRRLGTVTDGLVEELLSPDIGGAFETFLSIFAPGAELPRPMQRDSEEEGYVIQGQLDLWIAGRWHHLHSGDSFRIVREPFRWRNPGSVEARAVWVIAPPVY